MLVGPEHASMQQIAVADAASVAAVPGSGGLAQHRDEGHKCMTATVDMFAGLRRAMLSLVEMQLGMRIVVICRLRTHVCGLLLDVAQAGSYPALWKCGANAGLASSAIRKQVKMMHVSQLV